MRGDGPIVSKPKPQKGKKAKRKHSKSERRLLEKELWDLTARKVKARDKKPSIWNAPVAVTSTKKPG